MTTPVYMLDTNIISDILRNPRGAAARRARAEGWTAICTSAIAECELAFGVKKSGAERLRDRIAAFLSNCRALPFDPQYSADFADIRVTLEKAGTPIGPFDLLIAAHARALGLTLVTDNVREFSRVDGLKIENWLERTNHD